MKKRSIIAILLVALFVQMFSFAAFADDKESEAGYNGNIAGHEYDNVDVNAWAEKEQIITELIQTSKSFGDIKDENLSKYAGLLNELGIVNGYEDGTFRPENSISRGEISAITVRMLGHDAEVLYSLDEAFYDVDNEHIFYKEISACVNLGIINGYNDNTFRSENTISYNELAAIVVRALGYEQMAQLSGGYPTGYLVVANDIGITKGVTIKDKNAISRGEAATVVYKALHAPLLKQTSFGDDVKNDSDRNVTVLSENHDIYKGTGVVKANSITSLNSKKAVENTLLIDDVRFKDENAAFSDYLGYKVDFYYRDVVADMPELVYVTKNITVKELVITADTKVKYNNLTYVYEASEDKTKTAAINTIHDLVLNGQRAIAYEDDVFDITSGMVKLVSNEGKNTYDTVFIETYENYILRGITGTVDEVKLTLEYDYKPIVVDIKEKTKLDIVDLNGNKIDYIATIAGVFDASGKPAKTVDFSGVKTDTVISVYTDSFGVSQRGHKFPSEDAEYIKIIVSDKKVTGTVEAYDTETVKDAVTGETIQKWKSVIIGGKEYKFAENNYMNEPDCECKFGYSGTFYLDSYNKITAFVKGDSEDGDYEYGYLIDAKADDNFGSAISAKIMTLSNDKTVFSCTNPVFINDKPLAAAAALSALSSSAKLVNEKFTISQVVKYKTNADGIVTHIQTVLQSVGLPASASTNHLNRQELPQNYHVENDTSGRLQPTTNGQAIGAYFQPATYFTVPATEEYISDDTVYQVGSITNYGSKTVELYDVEYLKPNLAVIYDSSSGEQYVVTTVSQTPVMVKEVTVGIDESGFGVSKIKVVNGLAEKEYMGESLDTFKDASTGKNVQPGDMIMLSTKGKDIISSWSYVKFGGIELTKENVENGEFKEMLNLWQAYSSGNSGTITISRVAEPYIALANRKNEIVFQAGPVVDEETNKRESWFTGHMNTNTAWQKYGALVCDASQSKEKPSIRVGAMADFKSVYTDGAENASLVFFAPNHGGATMYIIYTGFNK